MEGKIHTYHSKRRLPLFEYTSSHSNPNPPKNILLFIGGLFDSFVSTSYIDDLASLFQSTSFGSNWVLIHPQLSSASRGWGISNLDKDVEEISECISFIRNHLYPYPVPDKRNKINVVLMGHSTGCQDLMHYLLSPSSSSKGKDNNNTDVQGIILQAPVSDRESILHSISTSTKAKGAYDSIQKLIKETPKTERNYKNTIIPLHLAASIFGSPVPISLSRWNSLISPGSPEEPSIEDFFSSDLPAQVLEGTFGKLDESQAFNPIEGKGKEVLVLMSEKDEYVPSHIDKAGLLGRWIQASSSEEVKVKLTGKIIEGAKHDLSGLGDIERKGRMVDMRSFVLEYLERVVGEIPPQAWDVIDQEKKELELGKGVKDLKL